jgi:glycosyltransferase involved in cell wall biosynthesis
MGEEIFISICIPAYKRTDFLKRLLDSILIQTYHQFEVVITDDSPDNEVLDLARTHGLAPFIRYFKNEIPLGAPENWNESMRRAKGEWIKLMHDDDWFSNSRALQIFAGAIAQFPDTSFFFSRYKDVFLENNKSREVQINWLWNKILLLNPKTLLSRNVIGPPSVIFHKKNLDCLYDRQLKWLVDIDYYMRFLQFTEPKLIPEELVDVGIGEEQLTQLFFRNPVVEIPENLYLLNKIGVRSLKNIIVYDACWRFIRNLNVRSIREIRNSGYLEPVPAIVLAMIKFQSFWPKSFLKIRILSKCLMGVYFIFQYPKITRG